MSEVTNTPVTEVATSNDGSGKVELSPGGGPLTFDELDSVIKSNKTKKKESSDSKGEKKPEKSKDLTTDDQKANNKSTPKASEAKDNKEGKVSEAEEKPARKTIKAKYQDAELDLDEDAVIPVTINGKQEFVPVKDLMSNYSGKTAWDRKFTDLSKVQKQTQSERQKLDQASQKIKAIFEEKDPQFKMFRMAELAGVSPIEFRQKFFDENLPLLEKWYSMSEDERKADALAYEAKYHKYRADTLEGATKREQAHRELSSQIESLRARHNVSEDEFVGTYDNLSKAVQEGKADKSVLSPDFIVEVVNKEKMYSAAEDKINELGLPMDEARSKWLFNSVNDAYKLGLSAKELVDLVDETIGSGKARKIVDEKKKERDEFMHGKKPAAQVKHGNPAPVFFEDV